MPTLDGPDREPIWWMAHYIVICEEAEPDLASDLERARYRDQMKQQGPDDPVLGTFPLPRNVDVEQASLISEEDWETGLHWAA